MNQTDEQRATRPTATALWTMRGLALIALAVAGFLLYIDIGYLIARATTKVPFCSWAEWLDCNAVLFDAKWSHWFGVPVAVFGFATYLLVLILLFMASPGRPGARWVWVVLHGVAIAVIGAAAWFIYLQVGVIGRLCQYCLIEHALGVVLALMLVAHARRFVPTGRVLATAVAFVGVVVLVAGQYAYEPVIVEKVVIGEIDDLGKYVEPNATASLQHDWVQLDPTAHMLIGADDAEFHTVIAIDYTCPHCRSLHEMFEETRELLGPKFAVIVLPYPINHHCNPIFIETPKRHEAACDLARLAHAVWLVDRAKFPEFHGWLFENQEGMTYDRALEQAKSLVDTARLEGYRADPDGDPQRLLQRDIKIANRLGMKGRLPGIFVADSRFTDLPEDGRDLADLIHTALGQ